MKIQILLFVILALAIVVPLPPGNSAEASVGWKPAFSSDFTDGHPLEDAFNIVWGQGRIQGGKLVITPDKRHGTPSNRVMLVVDNLRFPGNVHLEIRASLSTKRTPNRLHLGLFLNSDGYPATDQIIDWTHGYLLCAGAKGNTATLLRRANVDIATTVRKQIPLQSDREYTFSGQRDGNTISLSIDDKPAFAYVDDHPVSDLSDSWVGAFSEYNTLTISKLSVFTKGLPGEAVSSNVNRPEGPEATLKGMASCARSAAAKPADGEHTVRLYAYEGTSAIRATMEELLKNAYRAPMDVEAAASLQKEMDAKAMYEIASNPVSRRDHHSVHMSSQALAVTGVVFMDHGRKCLWPTKIELLNKENFQYPKIMLRPDQPLVVPKGNALLLKVSNALSLACVPIPAGRFLQGSLFFVTRWQDEFPHEVTITKPFYMTEHPITQEMCLFSRIRG